jgi:hypothetical protein
MQNNLELQNNSKFIGGESIFNKTCTEISNRLIVDIPNTTACNTLNPSGSNFQPINQEQNLLVPQTNSSVSNIQQAGNRENNIVDTKSSYYSFFGFEYSLWTWILILLILLTIIYFIYKFFFSNNEKIVTIKKSKNIAKLNDSKKEKLNDEISDSESESESNESSSSE